MLSWAVGSNANRSLSARSVRPLFLICPSLGVHHCKRGRNSLDILCKDCKCPVIFPGPFTVLWPQESTFGRAETHTEDSHPCNSHLAVRRIYKTLSMRACMCVCVCNVCTKTKKNRKLALVGKFLIKFSSLSAPIPAGLRCVFFVWSGCQFFYLCRSWKRREFEKKKRLHRRLWLLTLDGKVMASALQGRTPLLQLLGSSQLIAARQYSTSERHEATATITRQTARTNDDSIFEFERVEPFVLTKVTRNRNERLFSVNCQPMNQFLVSWRMARKLARHNNERSLLDLVVWWSSCWIVNDSVWPREQGSALRKTAVTRLFEFSCLELSWIPGLTVGPMQRVARAWRIVADNEATWRAIFPLSDENGEARAWRKLCGRSRLVSRHQLLLFSKLEHRVRLLWKRLPNRESWAQLSASELQNRAPSMYACALRFSCSDLAFMALVASRQGCGRIEL